MAYTDRGNTGNRDSHGWAIAGAFAGQAGIIVGIGALLAATGGAPAATQSSAVPAPAAAQPAPAISVVPQVQPMIPYQVAMDGQRGGDVFPQSSSVPSFTVEPGQDLTVSLGLGPVPSAVSVSGISWSLVGTNSNSDAGAPEMQTPYNDSVQAQSPGTYVTRLSWPGSASELQPGTQWTLVMTAGGPGQLGTSPIANITVAP
jgi:hypothetical protein